LQIVDGDKGSPLGAVNEADHSAIVLQNRQPSSAAFSREAEVLSFLTTYSQPREAFGRLVKHACSYWLMLGESHLTRRLFGSMVRRIAALPAPIG
jgi:hypothetical protein